MKKNLASFKKKSNQYYILSGLFLTPFFGHINSAWAIETGCGAPQTCPPVVRGGETCSEIWVAGDCACETTGTCSSPPSPPPSPPAAPPSLDYGTGTSGNADSTMIGTPVFNPLEGDTPTYHNCNPTNVTWSQNGYTCTGGVSGCDTSVAAGSSPACPIPFGTTVSVNDTSDRGNISYYCNGASGTLSVAGPGTCSPIQYCPPSTVTWTVGSNSCSASAPEIAVNTTTDVSNSSGSSTATFECVLPDSGSSPTPVFLQVDNASATCTPPVVTVTVNCPSTSESWTGGCVGTAPAETGSQTITLPASGSQTYTFGTFGASNSTAGRSGSAFYDCTFVASSTTTNGSTIVGSYTTTPDASPASSCNLDPSCSSGTVSWSVSGVSCSSTVSTGAVGASTTVSASGTTTGSDVFQCESTSPTVSTWTSVGPASCTTPVSCPATTVHWTGSSGSFCSGSTTAGTNGSTQNVSAATGRVNGHSTFECESGTWVDNGPDTCISTNPCSPDAVRTGTFRPDICASPP